MKEQNGSRWHLNNGVLAVELELAGGPPRLLRAADLRDGRAIASDPATLLRVERWTGNSWQEEPLRPVGDVKCVEVQGNDKAIRKDDRFPGYKLERQFELGNTGERLTWWAELREEAPFVVTGVSCDQSVTQSARRRLVLFDARWPGSAVQGMVSGSPITAEGWFLGCEHPLADNQVTDQRVLCAMTLWPVPDRKRVTYTFALGSARPMQLRRDFQAYVERRRARPYKLFVNYNSWWDIATGGKRMTEAECLAVIREFGEQLTRRRGVALDSFVFDDGWDDPRTLWAFHGGFPQGFAPLAGEAAKYQSAIGTWLSPFGGYGQAKEERLAYGRQQGYEVADYGFSLAGPRYFSRFRSICQEMIEKYGVNYFKFDGIAGNNASGAGERFAADVEALLRLCEDLRQMRPDVYLSITTGTWPSPYWLWYGDSVWRNGDDCGVTGWGHPRQRWITYRDAMVKRMIVERAPLYPLNSLMTIPVCYASLGLVVRLGVDAAAAPDDADLRDEMWMGFASGTQLAELYVTPRRLSPAAWDQLAECIRWARENQEVLRDVHWVGGDPQKGEVYGYGAWRPGHGVLILRNPFSEPREFTFRLRDVWELPENETRSYNLRCRYARQLSPIDLTLAPDAPHSLVLPPWGIILWEGSGN